MKYRRFFLWGSPQFSPQRAICPFSIASLASVLFQVQNALTYLPAQGKHMLTLKGPQGASNFSTSRKRYKLLPCPREEQIKFLLKATKRSKKLKALILNLKTMHMYEPHWSLNIHFVFHPHCLWLQSFAKNITFKHNTSTFWKSPNPLFPFHCLPPPKYTTTNFW